MAISAGFEYLESSHFFSRLRVTDFDCYSVFISYAFNTVSRLGCGNFLNKNQLNSLIILLSSNVPGNGSPGVDYQLYFGLFVYSC